MRLLPAAIQRDVMRRFAGPFAFCFSVIMALLIMQFLILFTDRLVGRELPFGMVVRLILSNLASLVILAVPMSILAASLLVYGKVSEWNEYTALKAAGVHPWRLLQPVFWVSSLLAVGMIYFSDNILPEANFEARRLWAEIRLARPSFDVQPGVFYEGIDGYTFLAKRTGVETDSLYDVSLYRDQGTAGRAVFRAKRANLKSEANRQTLTLEMFDGNVTRWMPQSGTARLIEQSSFGSYRIRFDLSSLGPSSTNPELARNDRTMNIPQLQAVIDSIGRDIVAQKSFFGRKENLPVNRILSHTPDSATSASQPLPARRDTNTLATSIVRKMSESEYAFLRQNAFTPADRLTVLRSTTESLRSSRLDYENLELNLRWRQERVAQYTVEIYKKFSVPFVCILFFLCGACIGLIARRGNLGFAALISAVLSTVYWISLIQGEKWADRLFISPVVGMWMGNLLLGLLAAVLLFRVVKERYPFQRFREKTA